MKKKNIKKSFWGGRLLVEELSNKKLVNFFLNNFEMITLPVKIGDISLNKNDFDFSKTVAIANFAKKNKLVCRAHTLVWLHKKASPKWLLKMGCQEFEDFINLFIPAVVKKFKKHVSFWEVFNEPFANDTQGLKNLNPNEIIKLIKLSCDLTRASDRHSELLINFSDIFGVNSIIDPIKVINILIKNRVDFDSIGIQLHFGPHKELSLHSFEQIKNKLNLFFQLGIPIHITEMSLPSTLKTDPNCFFPNKSPVDFNFPKNWSEKIQYKFVKKLFSFLFENKLTQSITWWDMSDSTKRNGSSTFVNFGGLFNSKNQPKLITKVFQNIKKEVNI